MSILDISLCTFLIMPLTRTSWVQGYKHNFFYSFIGVWFTQHKIHPLWEYNSVIFSECMQSCNHPCGSVLEHIYHPRTCPPFPLLSDFHSSPRQCWSISMDFPFLTFHINRITQYIVFVSFLSLRILYLWSIDVAWIGT